MIYLVLMTIVWAFSFPLIGHYLSGQVDNALSIVVRFLLAFLVFVPLMNFKTLPHKAKFQLMIIGAIQLGFMYQCYYASFLYLSVSEVALFTIFTPLYISLFCDLCERRFRFWYLVSAALAVLGAYVIRFQAIDSDFIVGFLLVQGANICFGAGQSFYRAWAKSHDYPQSSVFGYVYLGALCVSILVLFLQGDISKTPSTLTQYIVLLYLGVVASGIGFFLWNKGASLVDSGILAIMNNAIIPIAIIVNTIGFEQDQDNLRLVIGGGIIAFSMWLHTRVMKLYAT